MVMSGLVILRSAAIEGLDHSDAQGSALLWRDRLASLLCFSGLDQKAQVFTELGQVASDLFIGVDWTVSDLAAAIVVLQQADRDAQRKGWPMSITCPHSSSDRATRDWSALPRVDPSAMADSIYFYRYANAVYGAALIFFSHLHPRLGALCL